MKADREQIADLIHAYAERLDAGDFARLGNLFARATLRSYGSSTVHSGDEAVQRLYQSRVRLYDGVPCTKHVTTNLTVEMQCDAASARSYFTVLQARPELPLQAIIAGRYHDTFGRDEGGWFFRDRLILVDLIGDLRFHLIQPLARLS